jgi:hypothetical protein
MSAIEATSGTYRSRVDGTVVLSVEIEPRYRAEALALFGMPGTPMALAALRVGRVVETKAEGGVGHYCFKAVSMCRDPQFWRWISSASLQGKTPKSEAEAAAVVREACKVESRNEFDTDADARLRFRTLFEAPYTKWLQTQRAAA